MTLTEAPLETLSPPIGRDRSASPRRYARRVPEATIDDNELADHLGTRFAGGDDTALRAAYDVHGPTIYTYCRRSVGPERAEDVTQEVFVSAWRARHRFDPGRGSLGAWLMGITKNRLVDNIRTERRHPEAREAVDQTLPSATDLDQMGDRMLVAEALRTLPERPREVVRLAYFEDLTHQQIADRMGVALGTVKSDLRRSHARIRSHLENRND